MCRLLQKIETLLMRSGKFRLPGNKQLYANAYTWNGLAVDVTATPVERPKTMRVLAYLTIGVV